MSDESGEKKESMAEGTLISHLLELRDGLIRAVICIALVFTPCAYYSNRLFTLLAQPLMRILPKGTSMVSTNLMATFMTPIKLALLVSLFISMPYVLYQVWGFIAPGLYKQEKRFAVPLLVSSVVLFYAGAAFCLLLCVSGDVCFLYRHRPRRRDADARHDAVSGSGFRADIFFRCGI